MAETTNGKKKEEKKRDGRGCTYKKRPFQALYWHARKFTQYAVLLGEVFGEEGKREVKSVAFGHFSAMQEAYGNSEQAPNLRYIGDSHGTDRDTMIGFITEAMSEALSISLKYFVGQGARRERWIRQKRFFHIRDLEEDLKRGFRKGVEHPRKRERGGTENE